MKQDHINMGKRNVKIGGIKMAVTFESYERRIDPIKPVMEKYGIKDFEDALKICTDKGFNPYEIVK